MAAVASMVALVGCTATLETGHGEVVTTVPRRAADEVVTASIDALDRSANFHAVGREHLGTTLLYVDLHFVGRDEEGLVALGSNFLRVRAFGGHIYERGSASTWAVFLSGSGRARAERLGHELTDKWVRLPAAPNSLARAGQVADRTVFLSIFDLVRPSRQHYARTSPASVDGVRVRPLVSAGDVVVDVPLSETGPLVHLEAGPGPLVEFDFSAFGTAYAVPAPPPGQIIDFPKVP